MTSPTDDDARWAEAQSILDRAPTAPAVERLRQARRKRWLLMVGLVLLVLALAALFTVLVLDPHAGGDEDVPTWRGVVGVTISGLGLLFMVAALVVQFRALRRTRAWASPMYVLTRQQRKELLKQVRGQAPVVPERIPLARHLAELLLSQRLALPVQAGLLVSVAGLWIVDREVYRFVLIAILGVFLVAAGILLRRESRRARRFLDLHPAGDRLTG